MDWRAGTWFSIGSRAVEVATLTDERVKFQFNGVMFMVDKTVDIQNCGDRILDRVKKNRSKLSVCDLRNKEY